jgi:ABC-type Fe3+ transport system permease subunit
MRGGDAKIFSRRDISRLPAPRWRPDISVLLLVLLGALLCGLVLLPLGWLAWYSITDANGTPSPANFVRLATDPTFLGPYLTAVSIAAGVAAGASAAALPLAWLVARTDLPLRRVIRALVTASFVTPPFLGAIAWEILAAPNSGILNQWYRWLIRFVFLEFSQTQQGLWNTVLLGVLAATGCTFLALMVSYITTRKLAGHRFLGFLATAPIAIPGIVLGVGLFLSYTRQPLVLYGTLWILLLAFLTIELPGGYQQLQAAFRGLHPELEETGRIFGATRLGALRRITAPLLRTSLIATWCFVFIGVIRELSATIMLTTARTKVVSVIIYDLNESGDLGAISVLGITLLLITFAVVGMANRVPVLGGGAPRAG